MHAALNTLRQIGASIGTAGEGARTSGPLATAFDHTFIWALAMALVAIAPAVALLCSERVGRASSGSRETRPPGR
jgi:hypothetical protein